MRRSSNVVSQAENTAINDAFYGAHEPAVGGHLADLLNWYTAMKDDRDAVEYLRQYLIADCRGDDAETLKRVPKDWIPSTAAWLARLSLRGYLLSDHNRQTIENSLARAFKYATDPVIEDTSKYVPNVQERIREKASDFMGEVNGMIDDGKSAEEIFEWVRSVFPSTPILKNMVEKLKPVVEELALVVKGCDDQLKEAYQGYKPKKLAAMKETYTQLLHRVENFSSKVKVFKPRKKRAVNIDKVLSKFKYAKKDDNFNLVSIDPRKILNASELWVFNTKYNTLSVLRGDSLGIKGTSITGVDETKSFSKRIGRKTEETLKTALNGGKVVLRHLVDKPLKTNRIGDDTILLRVL